MGGCVTCFGDNSEVNTEDKLVERIIDESNKAEKKVIKILLLGAGESGKSTIVKQMRIIYGDGFNEKHRRDYTSTVHLNILKSMMSMCYSADIVAQDMDAEYFHNKAKSQLEVTEKHKNSNNNSRGISNNGNIYNHSHTSVKEENGTVKKGRSVDESESGVIEPEFRKNANHILSLDREAMQQISPATGEALRQLWKCKLIRTVFDRRREFHIMDSAEYFMNNIVRISMPDYIPSIDDVLRTRSATTGVVEYYFTVDRFAFRMVDVGGQRSKRRKWMHCFSEVTSIIFVVAISEFDEVMLEDKSQNRMRESLALFQSIVNYDFFSKTSMILFFNKMDLFTKKLEKVQFEDYFPEYKLTSGTNSVDEVKLYILQTYWNIVHNKDDKPVYFHFTCATDTENIALVFNSVKQSVLINNLKTYELL